MNEIYAFYCLYPLAHIDYEVTPCMYGISFAHTRQVLLIPSELEITLPYNLVLDMHGQSFMTEGNSLSGNLLEQLSTWSLEVLA